MLARAWECTIANKAIVSTPWGSVSDSLTRGTNATGTPEHSVAILSPPNSGSAPCRKLKEPIASTRTRKPFQDGKKRRHLPFAADRHYQCCNIDLNR